MGIGGGIIQALLAARMGYNQGSAQGEQERRALQAAEDNRTLAQRDRAFREAGERARFTLDLAKLEADREHQAAELRERAEHNDQVERFMGLNAEANVTRAKKYQPAARKLASSVPKPTEGDKRGDIVSQLMLQLNPATGRFYTSEEANDEAKKRRGYYQRPF